MTSDVGASDPSMTSLRLQHSGLVESLGRMSSKSRTSVPIAEAASFLDPRSSCPTLHGMLRICHTLRVR
jgi:hypothetical protein